MFIASCGDDASNVSVPPETVSKKWIPASLLENDLTVETTESEVAIDEQGNAFVVWCQNANTWITRYSYSDTKWSKAIILIPNNRTGSYKVVTEPHIAVDQSGNAMLTWLESGDAPWKRVWAKKYNSRSDTWGTAILVETNTVSDDAKNPRIFADKYGNFTVIWVQGDRNVWPFRNHIWANRYSSKTNSWGIPQMIDSSFYSEYAGAYLQAAIDDSGNIIVVWNEWNSVKGNLWANRYSATKDKWETQVLLNTGTMTHVSDVQISIDKDGNAVAVWVEDDSNTGVVYSRRYVWMNRYSSKTGTWAMSLLIPPITTGDMFNPQVVIDGNGNASIVGAVSNGGYHLWESNYNFTDDSISVPKIMFSDESLSAKLAVDKDGNKFAIFSTYADSVKYWSTSYDYSNNVWGPKKEILAEKGWGGGYLKLATNSKGNAVTAWSQTDGLINHLWGSILK